LGVVAESQGMGPGRSGHCEQRIQRVKNSRLGVEKREGGGDLKGHDQDYTAGAFWKGEIVPWRG